MNEESAQNFTYQAKELQTHFGVGHLLQLEKRVIATMMSCEERYSKVVSQCSPDDFTFHKHKRIIEFCRSNEYHKAKGAIKNESNTVISNELDLDIAELLAYSREKFIALQSYEQEDEKRKIHVKIITKYGDYTALYISDRLCTIDSSNDAKLPKEFCDIYLDTFNKMVPLMQDLDSNPTQLIPGEDSTFDSMWVIMHKEIHSIEAIERLIQWANENDIDASLFPRTKEKLTSQRMFELNNLNLKELPSDLLTLSMFSLSIVNNQIAELPEGKWYSYCFLGLWACNNQLNTLPKTLFEAKNLEFLCLHGNRFENLPDEIGRLKQLKTFSISNNPIGILSDTLRNLSVLKTLGLENTSIDILPEWIFEFKNLEEFSFDDKHLPFLMLNKEFLSQFEMINLVHSEYNVDYKLIAGSGLEIVHETWMEPNDYLGHGCIRLAKKTKE